MTKEKSSLRKHDLWKRIVHFRWMYFFLIPAVIWYLVFAYAPIYGIQIAFKNFNIMDGVAGSPWVGLQHFDKMFHDPLFWRSFQNTLVISALKLIFVTPSGLILALMLNEVRTKRLRSLVQDVSLLPHFFSWVVIASIMTEILSPSSGLVNEIIKLCGGEPIFFLADKNWFYFWLVASDVWESAGWNSIIFIAAIAGIPPELYESASIDGAGRWKQMFYITLPCIAGTIVVVMILKVGSVLNAGFDQIFNLYNSAVMDSADIIETYVYRLGVTNMKYSYSTAVGLFKNAISLGLVILTNWLSKKAGQDGLW